MRKKRGKRRSLLARKIGGLGVASGAYHWMKTLDYRAFLYEPEADPVHVDFRGPAIFLFWHEYIPFLFYLRGGCDIAMLLSRHHDAEWLSQAARHMGFSTVRGSTFRGGGAALRELARASERMNLAITPDGPRGPRRKLAQGAIFLSSKLGIPLVAIGLGYQNPWRMKTWDRFAIPKLGSRARAVVSPRIQIPADLDRDGIEHYRQRVEATLNCFTDTAEQWAADGGWLPGQVSVKRQGRRFRARADADQTLPLPEALPLRRSA